MSYATTDDGVDVLKNDRWHHYGTEDGVIWDDADDLVVDVAVVEIVFGLVDDERVRAGDQSERQHGGGLLPGADPAEVGGMATWSEARNDYSQESRIGRPDT